MRMAMRGNEVGMNTVEKLQALREQMRRRKIAAYIVPTEDFHGSEYVGDYFKTAGGGAAVGQRH